MQAVFAYLLDHADAQLAGTSETPIPFRSDPNCGANLPGLIQKARPWIRKLNFIPSGSTFGMFGPTDSTKGKAPPEKINLFGGTAENVLHLLVDPDAGAAVVLHELSHIVDGYCGWSEAPWEAREIQLIGGLTQKERLHVEARAMAVEHTYFQALRTSQKKLGRHSQTRANHFHTHLSTLASHTSLESHTRSFSKTYGHDFVATMELDRLRGSSGASLRVAIPVVVKLPAQMESITQRYEEAMVGLGPVDPLDFTGWQNVTFDSSPLQYFFQNNLHYLSREWFPRLRALQGEVDAPQQKSFLRATDEMEKKYETALESAQRAFDHYEATYKEKRAKHVQQRNDLLGCRVDPSSFEGWAVHQNPSMDGAEILTTLGLPAAPPCD